MESAGNRGPMVLRKKGWKGTRLVWFGKVRSALPRYRVVVVLSIVQNFFSWLLRTATRPDAVEYLRKFRNELKDFLVYRESSYNTPVERFIQHLRGWEERLSPQQAIELIGAKISELSDDPRLPELLFSLSNAHFLAGEYTKHADCVRLGLEKLQAMRVGTELDKLGVKLLFTEDWGWGIGHCTHLAPLVKLRDLGLLSPQERIIIVSPEDGANKHYLNYWKKHLRIVVVARHEARQLLAWAQPITEKLFGFELKDRCVPLYEACNIAGARWREERRPPVLTLEATDDERGRRMLESWGLPHDAWFVTLHVREYNPNALNHLSVRAAPNADIRTYFPAIRAITERGGWVIRIGDPSMSELPPMPGVIDYANSPDRADWPDVFLCASCKFFIGTSSGPVTLPPTFNVPVLYTNACVMGVSHDMGRALVLPKLFFSEKENRLLTIRETLANPISWTVQVPVGSGVDLRDNTPDEIVDAVDEMFARLDAGPSAFEQRSELQKQFDDLRVEYGGGGDASTPMAESFARKHIELFRDAGYGQ